MIEGWGKLVAKDTVEVDGTRYTGKHVVLATGSYARTLPGLEIGGRVITSDQALELDWVPKSVVVLGGGVIGSEFARRCRTCCRARTRRSRRRSSVPSASAASRSTPACASRVRRRRPTAST